jgi:N-acyl-phosphatidylethanolamine-hydrolysing phospholipase D
MAPRLALALSIATLASSSIACGFPGKLLGRNASAFFSTPAPVAHKLENPVRKDARLAVLWIGHATALVQIDDKFILTDPVFTSTVGQISRRLIEPGLDPEKLPPLDAVVISHLHYDHLSLGSLEMIEKNVGVLLVPQKGLVYVPNYAFESIELPTWQTWESNGLSITATPVRHSGFRAGVDRGWMDQGYTGYVISYHGITVYFGGDTAYDPRKFVETAARFPSIDLAVLPIAPVGPRDFMEDKHVDPAEAVQIFLDLKARFLIPVHFDTFINSTDEPGEPAALLRKVARDRKLAPGAVKILAVGEQQVILPRGG